MECQGILDFSCVILAGAGEGSPFSVDLLCEEAPGTQQDRLNSVVELTCDRLIYPHNRKVGLCPKVARHGDDNVSFHVAVTKEITKATF